MKIILSILLILFCNSPVAAQKMPSDYFQEADKFYEDKAFDNALAGYQYIVDHYPKNELYPRAYYNVGYIYFEQKEFDKAIPVFNTILQANFNEREQLGGGIMSDPYTNYRHRAAGILSDIYYDKENFDSALYYFAIADSIHPYLHFCGNEYAANDVYKALRYAAIYEKLKQPREAIKRLLPAVFITLANNSNVIAELQKLLAGIPGLKDQLDVSLKNMYAKKMGSKQNPYTKYYCRFLGTEIIIPENYETSSTGFDKQAAIQEIMQTDFYKMIAKLQ